MFIVLQSHVIYFHILNPKNNPYPSNDNPTRETPNYNQLGFIRPALRPSLAFASLVPRTGGICPYFSGVLFERCSVFVNLFHEILSPWKLKFGIQFRGIKHELGT